MKTNTIAQRWLRGGVLFALLLLFGAQQALAGVVVLKNGRELTGKVRIKRDGSVVVETAMGTQEFSKDQVAKAEGDKPPQIDAAMAKLKAKQYAEAIPLLKQIAAANRGLGWDIRALELAAKAQTRSGDAAGAVTTYEELQKLTVEFSDETRLSYFDALLKTGQYDKLEGKLDEFIASGTRSHAAKAQIMRGDIKAAQGQLDNAVLDYMRTAILFTAQEDVQPEALFKAAEALEQLRDKKAKDLYQRLVEGYPSSPYAQKAKAKL